MSTFTTFRLWGDLGIEQTFGDVLGSDYESYIVENTDVMLHVEYYSKRKRMGNDSEMILLNSWVVA